MRARLDAGAAALPDIAFAVAISALPGVGPAALRRLLGERPARWCFEEILAGRAQSLLGAAVELGQPPPAGRALSAASLSRSARQLEVATCWRDLCRQGVAAARLGEPAYPARLAADCEAPALLFSLGAVPAPELPAVAVVGTRSCTHYGEDVAAELARALAVAGVVVVSGLAAGIDCAAHGAALSAGSEMAPPLGIVGGGVDVIYPPAAARLWQLVAERGALVSEAPPGTAPQAWRFPQRNRLLAAMSDVVVVVESHRRGGALHTVEAAAQRGIPVGAVPGSVRSPASAGTNNLLADGAHVVRDVEDVFTLVELARAGALTTLRRRAAASPVSPVGRAGEGSLEQRERQVLAALEHRAISLGEVMRRSGLSLEEAAWTLEQLARHGHARRAGAGWERRR